MMSWRKGFSALGILLLVAGIFSHAWAAAEKRVPKFGRVKSKAIPDPAPRSAKTIFSYFTNSGLFRIYQLHDSLTPQYLPSVSGCTCHPRKGVVNI